MCFSPSASFLASAGLTAVGVLSSYHVNRKGHVLLAVPFLFALQQAAEGFQWLALSEGASNTPLAYAFLFFAYLVWPVYVPFAVFLLDEKNKRRMVPLLWIGASVSLGFLLLLFTRPIDVEKVIHSIAYGISAPLWLKIVGVIAYVSATVGPFLLSSMPALQWFGLVLACSFVIAYLVFAHAYVSVWCFFGALLSGLVYWLIKARYRRDA